jgi:hypothetical protein
MTGADPKLPPPAEFDKFAIDATIKHQVCLLDLMKHTDTRAQQLVSMYTGLVGAAVVLATSKWFESAPGLVRLFIFLYAAFLAFGAMFAFQACQSVELTLPSRSGNYWNALRNDPRPDDVTLLLMSADQEVRKGVELQSNAARSLKIAMNAGRLAIWSAAAAVFCNLLLSLPFRYC